MVASVKTVAVAFVDPQNAPIFIKRFDNDMPGMDMLFILNGALDAFDDVIETRSMRRANRKSYLGLLNLIDGFAVFGFLSNTLIKTIVVLDAELNGYAVPSDTVTEAYLYRLYSAYVETVSNPFFDGFDYEAGTGESQEQQSEAPSQLMIPSKTRYPELQQTFHDNIVKLVEEANLV